MYTLNNKHTQHLLRTCSLLIGLVSKCIINSKIEVGYTASEFKQFLLVQVYNEMPFQREKKKCRAGFHSIGNGSLDCEK